MRAEDALVPITLEGYLILMAAPAILIALVLWYTQRAKRREREHFLGQWDPAQLRMSPFQLGVVYRLIRDEGDETVVVPIWNRQAPTSGAKELRLSREQVMPFDRERFF